ncbi:MAG: molybdopterin-dependent oxidoreductase [Candidatus Eisenbacteria bacterium]|nr:molybdopterin-dependent oxidoreductase [Candidatus Eisenbacteria bacterium]
MTVSFSVNSKVFEVSVPPGEVLLDTLRGLGFKGVKDGCRSSDCGCCTVLLDGRAVASCSILTGQVEGRSITTIEGIGDPASPHPLQSEFLRRSAAQCAYCMQGMIVSAKALLDRDPQPTEQTIRRALSGNLCRCTGYVKAVEAVKAVVDGSAGRGPASSAEADRYASVGRSVAKTEGLGLVSGRARYTDDFPMAGMLHGRIKRSPHAHARIRRIDASKAIALPGVHCVLTYQDVERVPFSTAGQNCPEPSPYDTVMLDSKVRFVGDRVAAVAADTPVLAEKACSLIEVEYEVLPAILDPARAMDDGAPVIHDEDDASGIEDASRNLAAQIDVEVGNVSAGFARAARVFEQEYRVQYVHGTPTEPHVAMSYLDEKDRLVVISSTQVPFHARRIVARVNGLPISRVRVVKPRIGGAFGAKQEVVLDDICAALTLRTRRPVKLKLDRDEELYASRTRHPQIIRLKTGVDAEGRILAREMNVLCNTGAYGAHALTVPSNTGSKSLPLYRSDSLRFKCDSVYTNLPIAGALRGYGAPQGFFAVESQMDEIAHALGRDPVEYRMANAIRVGDKDPIAEHLGEGKAGFERIIRTNGLAECWRRVSEAMDWDGWHGALPKGETGAVSSRPFIRRGMGMSLAMHGSGIPGDDMGGATVKANEDGSFHLLIGATDLGTGSDTILGQMAAEVLGVPAENVHVYSSDTDRTPFDVGAYASSTTYISGGAVVRAAEQVRDRLLYHASVMMGEDAGDLICADGKVTSRSGKAVPIAEVAHTAMYGDEKEQISFSASNMTFECPPPFAAAIADVEVDMGTGLVDVLGFACAIDCGFPINPALAEGQIHGGVAMGLGYALSEQMLFDKRGRMLNANLLDYKIPTAVDTPPIKAILVTTDEPTGPFGAKSVSEIPVDVVAPAIANAIFAATGVRLRELPFTPERVLAGIDAVGRK